MLPKGLSGPTPPTHPGAGQTGDMRIAPALGIRCLLEDRDELRPGWDRQGQDRDTLSCCSGEADTAVPCGPLAVSHLKDTAYALKAVFSLTKL